MIRTPGKHGAPIFLIGYMASGKTTLGRALAGSTGRRFVDLDEYIEQSFGKSVARIFAENGEDAFRAAETHSLAELIHDCPAEGVVIACGGGTPCFGDNMSMMNEAGFTVWLNAPLEVVVRRLNADRAARPLVAKLTDGGELENFVSDNLARRSPFYSKAHVTFDSSKLESELEIEESVRSFVENFLKP